MSQSASPELKKFREFFLGTVIGAEHHQIPELVGIVSFPRSGNSVVSATLASIYLECWEARHGALQLANIDANRVIFDLVPDLHKVLPSDVRDSFLLKVFCSPLERCAKSHALLCLESCRSAIFIVRHPLDVIYSLYHYSISDGMLDSICDFQEFAATLVVDWLNFHVAALSRLTAKSGNTILSFENTIRQRPAVLGLLARHINCSLSLSGKHLNHLSFEAMKVSNPIGIRSGRTGEGGSLHNALQSEKSYIESLRLYRHICKYVA